MSSDQSRISITFVNHASILVATPEFTLLSDPWFSGSVFHDSWRLLTETPLESLDLSTLKYLWISHEHPDHFHFPTLRALKKHATQPITALFQNLPDKSVKLELEKMGYNVVELDDGALHELVPGFSVRCFQADGDSALTMHIGDLNFVNLNDCAVSDDRLRLIKDSCPGKVDLLLTQFGLAGYYANSDDTEGLLAARDQHMRQLLRYQEILQSPATVPFASYVYFCRPSNGFLNDAQVRIEDVVEAVRSAGAQCVVPLPMQEVWPLPADTRDSTQRAVAYWDELMGEGKVMSVDPTADPAEIETHGKTFMSQLKQQLFYFRTRDITEVFIRDIGMLATFHWRQDKFSLAPAEGPTPNTAGELGSGDMLFFLKFPWGADTLNITSAFHVLDLDHWRWLLGTKHQLYSIRKAPPAIQTRNRVKLAVSRIASLFGIDLRDQRLLQKLRGR